MYDGSRYILYAILAIPALIVGFYAIVIAMAMGPSVWFVVIFLALAAMATKSWIGEDETDTVERTNCPGCGAPNPVDADRCEYCDASLPET